MSENFMLRVVSSGFSFFGRLTSQLYHFTQHNT
jgi:hypothetical protein